MIRFCLAFLSRQVQLPRGRLWGFGYRCSLAAIQTFQYGRAAYHWLYDQEPALKKTYQKNTKRHPEVRHMSHPTCHPSHAWPFRAADSPIPGSIDALVLNVQLRRFDSGGSGHFLKGKAVRLRAHAKCKLCQQQVHEVFVNVRTSDHNTSSISSNITKSQIWIVFWILRASTATSCTTIAVGLWMLNSLP